MESKNTHMGLEFFRNAYRSRAGWEIGRPQKAFAEHFEQHEPESPILDVGCGSGDLAIFLAGRGKDVLGVDYVEAAIDMAREKARRKNVSVQFSVRDAFSIGELAMQFGSVVDSGFFHTLDDACRQEFVRILEQVLRANGRYYMLSSDVDPIDARRPRSLTDRDVRKLFGGGWLVREVRPTAMESSYYGKTVPGLFCVVQRLP